MKAPRRRLALGLVGLLWACKVDEPTSPDAPFDRNAFVETLRSRGASVTAGDRLTQPFFSVSGQILRVNGQDVQSFEYASEADARAAAAEVSGDGFTIRTSIVSWIAPPHFYQRGRLLVLYVGDDPVMLALLTDILGEQFAGA